MARLYTDGAESGDTSRISIVSGSPSAETSQHRSGAYSYRLGTNDSHYIEKVFGGTPGEWYLRFAFRENNNPNVLTFLKWLSGTTEIGNLRVVSFGNLGSIAIYDGSGNLRATSSAINFNQGSWHVFEIHVLHHTSTGVFQVKYDGTQIINFTGNTGSAGLTIDRLRFISLSNVGGASGTFIDDIALNDTTGGVDDTWCGDGGVLAALVPNGAGTYNDLSIGGSSPPGNAYQAVDEIPHTGDVDFIYSTIVDDKSSFAMSNITGLPVGAEIQRVWIEVVARESQATGDEIATFLKSGSAEDTGSDQTLNLAYVRYISAEYVENPDTSAPWTETEVNAIEAGVVVR